MILDHIKKKQIYSVQKCNKTVTSCFFSYSQCCIIFGTFYNGFVFFIKYDISVISAAAVCLQFLCVESIKFNLESCVFFSAAV